MQRTGVHHNGKMCSVEYGTEQIFCRLDSEIKAWFRRYVFLMWKKEHVEMCIGGFVFQRYGKSTLYGFRIFFHLSCSVCIILTNSLENGERGHVDGSNLFFVCYTCI